MVIEKYDRKIRTPIIQGHDMEKHRTKWSAVIMSLFPFYEFYRNLLLSNTNQILGNFREFYGNKRARQVEQNQNNINYKQHRKVDNTVHTLNTQRSQ